MNTMETLELWFPNYRNNPGVLSKELLDSIQPIVEHFQVTLGTARFEGTECFQLQLSFQEESYRDYIISQIEHTFGSFPRIEELKPGAELLGRVYGPGKVGFGIFVDLFSFNPAVNNARDVVCPVFDGLSYPLF